MKTLDDIDKFMKWYFFSKYIYNGLQYNIIKFIKKQDLLFRFISIFLLGEF